MLKSAGKCRLKSSRKKNRERINQVWFTSSYYRFENDFFEGSLYYPKVILFRIQRRLLSDPAIPEVINYRKIFNYTDDRGSHQAYIYDMQPTLINSEMDMLKFIEYAVDVEYLTTTFLQELNHDLEQFEKKFHLNMNRANLIATADLYRQELTRLLDNWNLNFLNKVKSVYPNDKNINSILKTYIHSRLDARLLNLRIAKKFFDCYALVKNYEKGYLLLSRAFADNKRYVDVYLDTFIKYECEKPLMYHFLKDSELSWKEVKVWEWKSLDEWVNTLNELKGKNSYIKSLLDLLNKYMSLDQIIDILETLAEFGYRTSNFYQSEKYYENLLYIYDNVYKLQLIKEHFAKKIKASSDQPFTQISTESIPRARALKNLKLNQKYVKVNNEIIKVCNRNHNFEKGLSYIANNVFLYYNSVKMINDTDPNKYPKKGYDNVILQGQENYDEHVVINTEFQNILSFFNREFKMTIALHKDIWISVNNNFDSVNGKLYKAVKNCLETLQKISKFDVATLWAFIEGFIPDFVKTNQFDPSHEYFLDMYYPSYTGVIEHREYERWILTKLEFIKLKGHLDVFQDEAEQNYAKPTECSALKVNQALKERNVMFYYCLKSDSEIFVGLLLTYCLYMSYRSIVPNKTSQIVQTYRSQLQLQGVNSLAWRWMLSEISPPTIDRIKEVLRNFISEVRRILDRRNEKIQKAKNIIPSFKDKFKLDHKATDTETECNILVMLKNRPLNMRNYRCSRFSKEYAENIQNFQTEHGLYELHSRVAPRVRPPPLVKKNLASTKSSKKKNKNQKYKRRNTMPAIAGVHLQEETEALRINEAWRGVKYYPTTDRYQLAGDLADHYMNTLLKEKNYTNGRDQIILEKQKECGPEIHIEASVAEINNTLFRFDFYQGGLHRKAHCQLSIVEDTLGMLFTLSPTSLTNYAKTKVELKLKNNLVDEKEKLMKENDLKFQSCYPIIYQFVGSQYFKPIFYPQEKVREFSQRLMVRDIVVLTLLNSMAYLFPIVLTELRFYPQIVMERFNLTFFTKYDLDSAQCLCMILYLLNHLFLPIVHKKKTGRVFDNSTDLHKMVELCTDYNLNLLAVYLTLKNIEDFVKDYKEMVKSLHTHVREVGLGSKEEIYKASRSESLIAKYGLRNRMNLSSVIMIVENLYNFVLFSQIFGASIVKSDELNTSIGARPSKIVDFKEKRLIGTRIRKGPDGSFYRVNLYMLINLQKYAEGLELFKACVEKFEQMKKVSKTMYTVEELTLFAWVLLSDKFFGFCISVENFYKLKIDKLKSSEKIRQAKQKKYNGSLSIVELPKIFHHCDKEYITFSQMMWIMTKGKTALSFKLGSHPNINADYGQIASELARVYSRMSILRSTKNNLHTMFSFMQTFYSSLMDQKKIRAFWASSIANVFIEPFLFEHTKINELIHDSDGVVNESRTMTIFKFNYDKFHKLFGLTNDNMINSLVPVVMGDQKKSKLQVQHLNSFVNVLRLLNIKEDLKRGFSSTKRIYDVDKLIDNVDIRVEQEKRLKADNKRSDLEIVAAGKELNKETRRDSMFNGLFDRNFREVKNLINNDFHGVTAELFLLANTNVDRVRMSNFILSEKQDYNFSYDKLLKKKKPIVTKGHLTENLEEAEKYFRRMIDFQKRLMENRV